MENGDFDIDEMPDFQIAKKKNIRLSSLSPTSDISTSYN